MIKKICEEKQATPTGPEESDSESDDEFEVDPEIISYAENDEYLEEDDYPDTDTVVELDQSIRKVRVPRRKWRCQSYHSMIDWGKELKTEPPYIASLTDEEVTSILDNPLQIPKWPNHTQAVERAVKAVTEACTDVTGFKERDGFIQQRIIS